jgi:hypothetical protein
MSDPSRRWPWRYLTVALQPLPQGWRARLTAHPEVVVDGPGPGEALLALQEEVTRRAAAGQRLEAGTDTALLDAPYLLGRVRLPIGD